MVDNTLLSLEDIVAANQKELPLRNDEDEVIGHVVIRALDSSEALSLFKAHNVETPSEGDEVDVDPEEDLELMNEIVVAGLVEPSVDEDTISQLGRFKPVIFEEILLFSGLAAADGEMEEAFQDDSGEHDSSGSGDSS